MPSLISGLILLSRVALWVVVATSVPSALSSHPPSTIANCSSSVTPIKPYGYRPFFHSYGPQLEGNKGWETWTLTLNHIAYDSMSVFEWSRGDPASPSSNLHGPGTFSMMTAYNGVSTSIADEFLYEEDEDAGLFHISIGENHLIFDGTVGDIGSWNYSVKFGGLESAGFMLLVNPGTAFEPSYKGVPSQLLDGYFTNLIGPRMHVNGQQTIPSGETWVLHDISTVKHSYAKKPVQDLVSSYSRASSYVRDNTISYFRAESPQLQTSDAAQIVIASQAALSDDLSGLALRYQATNDPTVLTVSSTGLNRTLQFPGCSETEGNQFYFETYPVTYRGALEDSAGGKTEYYHIRTASSFWPGEFYAADGEDSLGVFEVYTSKAAQI